MASHGGIEMEVIELSRSLRIDFWDFLPYPFPYNILLRVNIPLTSIAPYPVHWNDPRYLPLEHWRNFHLIMGELK